MAGGDAGATTAARILVVDGDEAARSAVAAALADAGYAVATAPHAAAALELVGRPGQSPPDLILLDLVLPDTDGLVLCAELKARADVPIILCGEAKRRRDSILGLWLGADDFTTKPLDFGQLKARIAAALRRAARRKSTAPAAGGVPPGPPVYSQIGDLLLDRANRRVTLGGEPLHLTWAEYQLLSVLMSHPDEVLTRQELAQLVWGYEHVGGSRAVDMGISRLRAKLNERVGLRPQIVSVRRRGYALVTAPLRGAARGWAPARPRAGLGLRPSEGQAAS